MHITYMHANTTTKEENAAYKLISRKKNAHPHGSSPFV